MQYRNDSDDAWKTSYAPTTTITLQGGCDYEVRVIVSDEAGNKETTDSFYCTTSLSVNYIDADGTEKTAIASPISRSTTTLSNGWYVVSSDVTIDSRITCQGDVHLILCDGCKFTSEIGISVNEDEATLTIYGQKAGTGALEVTGSQSKYWAAIGGQYGKSSGTITINGGQITATGTEQGAAIGGGNNGSGTVVVNGGTVNVTGGEYSSGIGGGYQGNAEVTVNGGNITATGGYAGAGIGGGARHTGTARIVINGGTVSATGGSSGAGIGGGSRGIADITINGGNITARGGYAGAGIGGGSKGPAEVTINGGTVSGGIGHFNGGTETVKLSWTDPTDSITATYYGDVTLLKTFNDGENTFEPDTVEDKASINGKTLTPGEAELKYFTVTWKNEDGTVLETDENVKSGTTPSYDGETPTKAPDEQYSYTFKGWLPEVTATKGDTTYTAQFESKTHTYGAPVWDWSDDHGSAKATFTCTDCGCTKTVDAAVTKTEETGKIIYTAAVELGGNTYTDTKTEIYNYVPASEPYIDNDGAYIFGHVSYYEKDGQYYAVNADGSVGRKLSDISLLYFDFELLFNDEYQISCYTGSYDTLKNNEMVIPKSFNGKKITHLGGADGFMKATGTAKQFTLVLNENITKINSNAFANTLLTKVTGNTSSLNELGGSSAFARVNSKGGYTLDMELDYPGTISCGYKCFDNVKVTVHIKHSAVLSADYSNAKSITYFFTDEHTYGEPVWNWSDDHSSAKATFTCSNEKCAHIETADATVTKSEETDKIVYTATVELDGETYTDTYTEEKAHTHTYGEPTWEWSDDHSTAKAIFTCTDGDDTQTVDAEVTESEETDKTVYTATVEFGGKTYTDTYTEAKEETPVYYPAAEPYIDDDGAYILGCKEHYRYQGKYYAVNKDKSMGEEVTDIWVSYFKFELLPDDTYQIDKYTGPTKNLTEIVIPKTFEGKKITILGTDNMDLFTRANKPVYTLVLNENITGIKPNAFYSTGVTKVTGDTSGLCKIGDYAFSWVNSNNGNKLDITFDYSGEITIGESIFTHTNVTVHINHSATFNNMNFGAASINYDFADAHTYGEPVWNWRGDLVGVTATFTCTDPRCAHSVTVDAKVTVAKVGDNAEGTAEVTFNGETYIDTIVKPWEDISGKGGDEVRPDSELSPSGSIPNPDNTPKTGDTTSPAAAAAILMASLSAALFLTMKRRKDEEA